MILKRTPQGRSALLDGDSRLGLIERRLLILSDGRRPFEQISNMLGQDLTDALHRLLREGYVLDSTMRSRPDLSLVPGQPMVSRSRATEPSGADAAPTQSRRSLVVSKVYLLDILELQRDAESASLRAAIRLASGEPEVLGLMQQALQHLQAVTTATFAQRVHERLAEVLPTCHLPLFAFAPLRKTPPTLMSVA